MIPLDGMRSSRASGNLLCPGLGIAALCLLGCGADAPAGGDGGATGATSAPDGVAPAEGAPTSDVPFAGPQAGAAASGGSGGTPGTPPVPDAAGSGAGGVSGASDGDDDAGLATPCDPGSARGHFQLERLDRGLVAVRVGDANYVGWRMLGHEYDGGDPERVAYRLYRDGELIETVEDSTNYLDTGAGTGASYTVSAVIDGTECPRSPAALPWAEPFLTIPLEPPPGGTTPDGVEYAYDVGTVTRSSGSVNDASPGDVDGDGQYELVVIWEPSNAKDNSQGGHTGPVVLDCYELSGERLWRMDLGRNVRAGAHYTQFLVYDFDGDGRAEVALRTAPGTRDGTGEYLRTGPAAGDDDEADYRDSAGRVLAGPEYLTVFEGATGRELTTVDFEVERGSVDAWGDDYGNRVDRFLASAGFVSDAGDDGIGSGRPAILMARGYYTRATVSAWTYRDGELSNLWTADSDRASSGPLAGQGAHSMVVADVDGDRAQEIVYGAAMIQSDGSFGCSTGLGHGDALHVGDLVPSRPGLEVFMPHEDTSMPTWHVRDAASCDIIHRSSSTGADNGRGVAADITSSHPGAEMWSAAHSELRNCDSGEVVGDRPSSTNFLIYWDADELRELEDGTAIHKGDGTLLLSCDGCMSNNHTKATPALTADLFGDWREEIIWRTPDSSALRVYTTTDVTQRRIYTLMHDPQYRMQVSSEQTGYNQPPHTGFLIGDGMPDPPAPDLHVP